MLLSICAAAGVAASTSSTTSPWSSYWTRLSRTEVQQLCSSRQSKREDVGFISAWVYERGAAQNAMQYQRLHYPTCYILLHTAATRHRSSLLRTAVQKLATSMIALYALNVDRAPPVAHATPVHILLDACDTRNCIFGVIYKYAGAHACVVENLTCHRASHNTDKLT